MTLAERNKWVLDLISMGLSFSQVGRIVGCTSSAVAGIVWRDKNPPHLRGRAPERCYAGAENPNARLTVENVAAIRARRAAGERLKVLAYDYGVDASNISMIARGVRW